MTSKSHNHFSSKLRGRGLVTKSKDVESCAQGQYAALYQLEHNSKTVFSRISTNQSLFDKKSHQHSTQYYLKMLSLKKDAIYNNFLV